MFEIPPVVTNKARALGATDWLASLPQLVAGLERDWGIRVAAPFPDATEAYVAPATAADGTAAVLKLSMPRDEAHADHEMTVLRIADGDGCVRLYRSDPERGAMLLERLGPSLYEVGLPIAQRLEILADLARRVWRPADDAGLPTGAEKAAWLAATLSARWEQLDRPCSERAVAHALECAERRRAAHDPERARMVHGDVHQWNALRAPAGWALVDPDGLFADPEYDLGVIMREDPVELLRDGPRNRAAWLAERTGRDETAIWEWGVVERVSTGLLATSIGLQPIDRQMLYAADVIAAAT
jgi:streptomycin 6-kinase